MRPFDWPPPTRLHHLLFAALVLLVGCGAAPPPEAASPDYAMEPSAMAPPPAMQAPAAPMALPSPPMAGSPGPMPMAAGASAAAEEASQPAPAAAPSQPGKQAPAKAGAKDTKGAPADKAAPAAAQAPAPMLIYVADMRVQVEEPALVRTLDRVIDIATSLGGYLAGRSNTSVQVRVPSPRFREALAAIETIGDVKNRSVTAEDVSEEFHDITVRLSNLRATQKRLQELYARASTMADVLTVERELERVGAEIDRLEGRMRYLQSRAAFSFVTVTVEPRPGVVVAKEEPPPPPPPRREVELPVEWLHRLGLDTLLNLN